MLQSKAGIYRERGHSLAINVPGVEITKGQFTVDWLDVQYTEQMFTFHDAKAIASASCCHAFLDPA